MKFVAAVIAVLICGTAQAGIITDLFDTGIDDNGLPLPVGSTDPHYTVSYSTIYGTGGSSAVTVGPTEGWIIPSISYPDGGMPKGYYDYQTSFTLPENADSVTISANISANLIGLNILLNGAGEGWSDPINIESTDISRGGSNILTFITINTPIYTGDSGVTSLQVVGIEGSYTVVPEPSGLVTPIFALVIFRGRHRRQDRPISHHK